MRRNVWSGITAAGLAVVMSAAAALADTPQTRLEQDRTAILAMAGEYDVTFDFREHLPIEAAYELHDAEVTPAREVVYVIADESDFISLQHLLLVGPPDAPIVIKHWRQDWAYEPARLMRYRGFNTWDFADLSADQAAGAWSQTVYQVDDSPRYAGLARWTHGVNASTWEPEVSWRPLPRRDGTTRDDYDVIEAVNRHTVTAWGWTHEQDNTKLVLRDGEQRALVREHGINTYRRTELAGVQAAEQYWAQTADYWALIRAAWDSVFHAAGEFTVDDDADGTRVYTPLLSAGQDIVDGTANTQEAYRAAASVMAAQVRVNGATPQLPGLTDS
ncbi:hypothetical protein L2D00_14395 [Hyphomonadaceae bacterium BL14]|nr:hypothetical protein L2D00_14395 [Hyphomonadaceae bacterium BL14]